MIAPSGAIEQNKQTIVGLVQTRTTTAADRDAKGSDFTTFTGYPQSTDPNVEPSMGGQANSSAELQVKIKAYNDAATDYSTQESQNKTNIKERDALIETIRLTDSNISTLQNQFNAKDKEKTAIDQKVPQLSGELNTAELTLTSATGAKTAAQTALDTAKANLEQSKKELADLQKQNPQDANAIKAKQAEVTSNQNTFNTASQDFDSAVKDLEQAQKAKDTAKAAYDKALADQQTITTAYTDLQNRLNAAKTKKANDEASLKVLNDAIDL